MARPPFVAHVVSLRRHQGHRELLQVSAPLPGLEVTGSRVPAGAAVALDVALEAVDGGIVVTGRIGAPWVGECRRCLAPLEGMVEATVSEVFVADAEEGVTYPISGDHIDLEPMARESVVLSLPLAPVCGPACRGLCASCGADRNAGDCGCPPAGVDRRWAALDALSSDPL